MRSLITRGRQGAVGLSVLGVAAVLAAVVVAGALGRGATPVEAQIPEACPENGIGAWDICVIKVTIPSDSEPEFGFEWDFPGGPDDGAFNLGDGEGELIVTTGVGDLTITETDIPDGWELTEIVCAPVDVTNWDWEPDLESNSVILELGEQGSGIVVCTFTNEPVEEDGDRDPVPTPDRRQPPNIAGAFGGIVGGTSQATPTPVPTTPAQGIAPPSTGDGGLK